MKIILPVDKHNVLDAKYGGYADKQFLIDNSPKISFPIQWSDFQSSSKYLHLILIDYDANPVCGYTYFHWGLVNLELAKYPNGITENFSYQNQADLNQAIHSGFNFDSNKNNKMNYVGYYGPFPPNCPHTYTLYLITTSEPLAIKNGWLMNEFVSELEKHDVIEYEKINFIYNNF